MKKLLLSLSICLAYFGYAQVIPFDVQPPSWKQNLPISKSYKAFNLPSFDVQKLKDEDALNANDKSKPWRFGHEIYVDHDFMSHGEWTTLDNGDKIWRMSYTSNGALTLNFMFDEFYLPKGSKLYVYNDAKDDLIRPFTHHNNSDEEVLGTWLVKGNQAWIEYHQPAYVKGNARLRVGSVVHGYRTAESFQKALNDSGACNHDVDCDITPSPDPFGLNQKKEDVKTANGMMVVGGNGFCSGTLVNNTNNDQTPYFLTANHCSGGEGSWAFRFNWRSPNPSCGTFTNSTNGSFNQTVSGAVVRARSSQSDMELVQINDNSFFTTNAANLVWAGWNRSTSAVPSVTFGIHHPSGDIQKTCRNNEGAFRTVANFNGNPNTQMWRINDWELGVTEQGSSGSALYNQDGHIIGMLSAGSAACSGTNDNGGFDIYGRFGVAWDFSAASNQQLKFWLDPAGTNPISLDQFPPLQTFDRDAAISITDLNLDNCNGEITPEIAITNAGNNVLSTATIVYRLNFGPNIQINWNGTLNNGESDTINLPQLSGVIGSNSFTVSVSNPNGLLDQQASNNTVVQPFDVTGTVCASVANTQFQTSTTGVQFNTISNLNTGKPSGYSDFTGQSTDVTVGNSYDLSVFANSDGNFQIITYAWIDWNQNCVFDPQEQYDLGTSANINNVLTVNSPLAITVPSDAVLGNTIMRITTKYTNPGANQFPTSCENGHDAEVEDYTLNVISNLSINEFDLNTVKLYPNPTNDILNITVSIPSDAIDYQIINALGQTVMNGKLQGGNITNSISVADINSGLYFVKLSSDSGSVIKKIIKE